MDEEIKPRAEELDEESVGPEKRYSIAGPLSNGGESLQAFDWRGIEAHRQLDSFQVGAWVMRPPELLGRVFKGCLV